jgi:hypothetical protein
LIEASCHCGAVRLTAPAAPESVTECNCSICRRLGARWAYFTQGRVRVRSAPGALKAYVWGDRTIEFYHCTHCGCPTHYESVDKAPGARLAINARCLDPDQVAGVRVRFFDGAHTWRYLDE